MFTDVVLFTDATGSRLESPGPVPIPLTGGGGVRARAGGGTWVLFFTDTVTADGRLSGWGWGVVRKPKTLTSPGSSCGLPGVASVHGAGLLVPVP